MKIITERDLNEVRSRIEGSKKLSDLTTIYTNLCHQLNLAFIENTKLVDRLNLAFESRPDRLLVKHLEERLEINRSDINNIEGLIGVLKDKSTSEHGYAFNALTDLDPDDEDIWEYDPELDD